MADSRAQENNQTWIADETGVHESASYGVNKESVSAALREQEKRTQLVKDYRGHLKSEKDEEIKEKYEALYVIAEKRLACLKDIEQIANLEDIFGDAASRVTARAAQLAREHEEPDTENPSASLARVAQGCIFAVQDNWSWVSKLVKCVDIHVRHASAYHQFYHELKESDIMMRHALGTGLEKLQAATDQEKRDPQRLLYQLKEFLTLFLHWRGRVDRVFKKSYEIIPVHMRTEPIEYYRPVTALCGYKTRQIDIHEGEEVTLTDNSKPLLWQIRNLKDQEAAVPSVVLVIPGPDTDAVMLANRLRLQLLGLWTQYLKESGRSLLLFLIFVFKQDWDEAELKKLRALPRDQKDALLRILQLIRDYFSRYWSQHPDYKKLVQRLDLFERFLAEKGNPNDRDLKFGSGFLNQMTTFEEVMNRYQDYWSQWEIYKIALESSRDPQYLVLPDNWENMDFFEISEVLKRWQLGLRGAVMSDMSSSGFESEAFESSITATTSSEFMTSRTVTETTKNTDVTDSGVTEETVTEFEEQEETAETDQLMHAEQEVKRTFVIAGVINTATDEEVSMQEAIVMGIINNKDGTYRNMKTGKFIPIPEAMNEGFIRVEFTSTKRSKEKRKDIGLITIKTTREHRPYTVKGVIDSKSDELFSVDDAIARGLLDQKKGVYRNTLHDTDMSLADAIDSGMLKVEYDTSVDVGKPEIITKTYAIHGVVDARRKTKITFTQAVQTGILDKETGAFTNNSTGEQMYVGDAIKKGFIKATVVKDPATLNIDPENKMVVEKLDVLRKKLLKPMIAIAALRKAAQASDGSGILYVLPPGGLLPTNGESSHCEQHRDEERIAFLATIGLAGVLNSSSHELECVSLHDEYLDFMQDSQAILGEITDSCGSCDVKYRAVFPNKPASSNVAGVSSHSFDISDMDLFYCREYFMDMTDSDLETSLSPRSKTETIKDVKDPAEANVVGGVTFYTTPTDGTWTYKGVTPVPKDVNANTHVFSSVFISTPPSKKVTKEKRIRVITKDPGPENQEITFENDKQDVSKLDHPPDEEPPDQVPLQEQPIDTPVTKTEDIDPETTGEKEIYHGDMSKPYIVDDGNEGTYMCDINDTTERKDAVRENDDLAINDYIDTATDVSIKNIHGLDEGKSVFFASSYETDEMLEVGPDCGTQQFDADDPSRDIPGATKDDETKDTPVQGMLDTLPADVPSTAEIKNSSLAEDVIISSINDAGKGYSDHTEDIQTHEQTFPAACITCNEGNDDTNSDHLESDGSFDAAKNKITPGEGISSNTYKAADKDENGNPAEAEVPVETDERIVNNIPNPDLQNTDSDQGSLGDQVKEELPVCETCPDHGVHEDTRTDYTDTTHDRSKEDLAQHDVKTEKENFSGDSKYHLPVETPAENHEDDANEEKSVKSQSKNGEDESIFSQKDNVCADTPVSGERQAVPPLHDPERNVHIDEVISDDEMGSDRIRDLFDIKEEHGTLESKLVGSVDSNVDIEDTRNDTRVSGDLSDPEIKATESGWSTTVGVGKNSFENELIDVEEQEFTDHENSIQTSDNHELPDAADQTIDVHTKYQGYDQEKRKSDSSEIQDDTSESQGTDSSDGYESDHDSRTDESEKKVLTDNFEVHDEYASNIVFQTEVSEPERTQNQDVEKSNGISTYEDSRERYFESEETEGSEKDLDRSATDYSEEEIQATDDLLDIPGTTLVPSDEEDFHALDDSGKEAVSASTGISTQLQDETDGEPDDIEDADGYDLTSDIQVPGDRNNDVAPGFLPPEQDQFESELTEYSNIETIILETLPLFGESLKVDRENPTLSKIVDIGTQYEKTEFQDIGTQSENQIKQYNDTGTQFEKEGTQYEDTEKRVYETHDTQVDVRSVQQEDQWARMENELPYRAAENKLENENTEYPLTQVVDIGIQYEPISSEDKETQSDNNEYLKTKFQREQYEDLTTRDSEMTLLTERHTQMEYLSREIDYAGKHVEGGNREDEETLSGNRSSQFKSKWSRSVQQIGYGDGETWMERHVYSLKSQEKNMPECIDAETQLEINNKCADVGTEMEDLKPIYTDSGTEMAQRTDIRTQPENPSSGLEHIGTHYENESRQYAEAETQSESEKDHDEVFINKGYHNRTLFEEKEWTQSDDIGVHSEYQIQEYAVCQSDLTDGGDVCERYRSDMSEYLNTKTQSENERTEQADIGTEMDDLKPRYKDSGTEMAQHIDVGIQADNETNPLADIGTQSENPSRQYADAETQSERGQGEGIIHEMEHDKSLLEDKETQSDIQLAQSEVIDMQSEIQIHENTECQTNLIEGSDECWSYGNDKPDYNIVGTQSEIEKTRADIGTEMEDLKPLYKEFGTEMAQRIDIGTQPENQTNPLEDTGTQFENQSRHYADTLTQSEYEKEQGWDNVNQVDPNTSQHEDKETQSDFERSHCNDIGIQYENQVHDHAECQTDPIEGSDVCTLRYNSEHCLHTYTRSYSKETWSGQSGSASSDVFSGLSDGTFKNTRTNEDGLSMRISTNELSDREYMDSRSSSTYTNERSRSHRETRSQSKEEYGYKTGIYSESHRTMSDDYGIGQPIREHDDSMDVNLEGMEVSEDNDNEDRDDTTIGDIRREQITNSTDTFGPSFTEEFGTQTDRLGLIGISQGSQTEPPALPAEDQTEKDEELLKDAGMVNSETLTSTIVTETEYNDSDEEYLETTDGKAVTQHKESDIILSGPGILVEASETETERHDEGDAAKTYFKNKNLEMRDEHVTEEYFDIGSGRIDTTEREEFKDMESESDSLIDQSQTEVAVKTLTESRKPTMCSRCCWGFLIPVQLLFLLILCFLCFLPSSVYEEYACIWSGELSLMKLSYPYGAPPQ